MNAARDFIENELIPMGGWVEELIESNRSMWDKPDHVAEVGKMVGAVDEEAFQVVHDKVTRMSNYERIVIQAYEKAKLDIAEERQLKTAKVFKDAMDRMITKEKQAYYAERSKVMPDKPTVKQSLTVEELPPLPAKFGYQLNERLYSEAEAKRTINQLIDCIAALYRRGGCDKQ